MPIRKMFCRTACHHTMLKSERLLKRIMQNEKYWEEKTMAEEFRRIWSFIEKAEPALEMLSVLVPGEEILQCYKTN